MKILGLDLGTNSLGWAVVEKEDGELNLSDKGVRIFQEGVKIEKGKEESKAAERTRYRSSRRIKYRRKLRKINTLKVLTKHRYCPELTKTELDNWRYHKIYPNNSAFREWWKTDEEVEKTPYFFRNLVVTKKLDLSKEKDRFAIGRAFYHISQRRGFLSNRLEETKESDGVVKKSIEELSESKGETTLGQYFYGKYLKGEKIRDIYTHREKHYLEEFNRICRFQDLPDDFVTEVRKAIFYQRPLKSHKSLVGKCVFEPKKPRCPISRPEFEEYRMLCFVNNIKIKSPTDEKMRFLNLDEKKMIEHLFFRKNKEYFNFEDIAKQLSPNKQYKFYKDINKTSDDWLFNYHMKTTVNGCPVSAKLRSLFGDDFQNVKFEYIRKKDGKESNIDINDIWHVLFTFDTNEKLEEFARVRLNLRDDQVKEFLKINLKRDYASLSLKAISKILPFLREGLIYSHSVFLANMDSVIPKNIWNDRTNQRVIKNEIYNIIKTQNEEKQIVEVVNSIIKSSRDENETWSDEAADIYKKELFNKIRLYFGKNRFEELPEEKKIRIQKDAFELLKKQMHMNLGRGEFATVKRIDERIFSFLVDNFNINSGKFYKLYHPSAINVYKPPVKGKDGHIYLGSPMVSSIRNPMAMRALHQLRKVINELIKKDIIDENTKIHIEMARGLLNANERKALQSWQKDNETKRKVYSEKIKEHLNGDKPSDDEILKYQLWEEQNHKCLYTGREIRLSDFLGANPKFDIEHTIPRSQSFDNSQANKTLCESKFNRTIKRNQIPYELPNYPEILERIEPWKEKYAQLDKQIRTVVRQSKSIADKDAKDKAIQKRHKLVYERNYWKDKYHRFIMKDVPEGFKNSQINDIGIITKYSRLYLKTYFNKVYTVKGNTVADFRKLWGLQDEYKKKERVNHIHHCIDAITIACITKENYENLAKFYHESEELYIKGVDKLPHVDKPWGSFTEDIKAIENEVLISHHTPDNLHKQSKIKLRKRGKIQYNKKGEVIYQQGDTVRGSLHKQMYYGAIERIIENKKGEKEKKIKYVVRKFVDKLEDSNIKNIVDDNVREIVVEGRKKEKILKKEIDVLKKKLQKADEWEEKGIKNRNYLAANSVIKLLPSKVVESSLKIFLSFFLAVDIKPSIRA